MSDLQRRDQKSCSALIGYASPLLHMTPCDVVDVKVESSLCKKYVWVSEIDWQFILIVYSLRFDAVAASP